MGRSSGHSNLHRAGDFFRAPNANPRGKSSSPNDGRLSVIKRGSWDKYGFTSPSAFVRCVSADDPQLKKLRAGADDGRSMETFLNRPSHR
jgi:hypothetical protein